MAVGKDLESVVRDLVARQQINDALVRYCRGVDRLDREIILSAYHPGANDNHGGFNGPVEDFVDWVMNNHREKIEASSHYVSNVLIDLQGDVARSESYIIAYHRKRNPDGVHDMSGWARCLDRFECRNGEWRIADRVIVFDKGRADPVSSEWAGSMTQDLMRGTRDVSDPSYRLLAASRSSLPA